MKFLIDAQLPRRLARRLGTVGHDAVHTRDLSAGNRTTDLERRVFAELPAIVLALSDSAFVELTTAGLVVHEG